ncbi:MAG: hypothetical protein QOF89_1972 [Acidobacteriota bacterium]|jgi:hypothetical protein|nr:hypothetical protein [Acidobacteriota bacterium]
MERFVLRFRGPGAKPHHDVEQIRSLPGTTVLDDSSSRMLLVETAEDEIEKLSELLPDWNISPERKIPLPDRRPSVRRSG